MTAFSAPATPNVSAPSLPDPDPNAVTILKTAQAAGVQAWGGVYLPADYVKCPGSKQCDEPNFGICAKALVDAATANNWDGILIQSAFPCSKATCYKLQTRPYAYGLADIVNKTKFLAPNLKIGWLQNEWDNPQAVAHMGADALFSYQTVFYVTLAGSKCQAQCGPCLLYTSDAADEEDSVDLGGRLILKKKTKNKK
eukprot:TRINITY_DN9792_c0_g1_i2.p1 TRINITY_DN9792_c0_g1~~TRINITY_DN9792_c0_g1_i2.p1  ORF type:complete len:197 (+),score=38.67 TRINITY_DN9792_c0_g1_i2:292-882(+)